MHRNRFHVRLELQAPLLTQASVAGKLGIDSPISTLADGRVLLPYSLIKGRLRQSWDELGLPDGDEWFGARRGEWRATRGRLRFTDFVEVPSPERAKALSSSGRRHRVRIDEETGAADDGMLQVIESPFAAGEVVVFEGEISTFGDAAAIRERLVQAFDWTPSFGAGRTIGFGRVQSVTIAGATHEAQTNVAVDTSAVRYDYRITMRDPFCLARRRIAENLFETDEVIPGSAIRGVAATTLNEILGRRTSEVIDAGATRDPNWAKLAEHFNAIAFTHAFPSRGSRRPVEPPLSIVQSEAKAFHDVALQEGPGLIGGTAPQFAIDWKGDARERLRGEYGWPDLSPMKEIRVRTAIDRQARRAAEAQLFSYEMLRPDDTIVWRGTADFSAVPDADRALVVAQLQALFAIEPAAWGKTKARGLLVLDPHVETNDRAQRLEHRPWVVTLQTPALLCDPSTLNETSGRQQLFAAYASAWHDLSNGAVRLVRFFAQQRLAGGYLVHRFRAREAYAPFVLTTPGSVFVLDAANDRLEEALAFIRTLGQRGLQLPKWAKRRYSEEWQRNPFLPDDGFGEVTVNLDCHREAIVGFKCLEPWSDSWTAPEKLNDEATEHVSVPPRDEEQQIGIPQAVAFARRWEITATLTTASDLHIGTGEALTDRIPEDTEAGTVAAVATDASGRAYLPGSGVKGALRSWLEARFPDQIETIARLFGRGGEAATARGGTIEIHDAHALPEQPSFEHVPRWCAARLTGVVAGVAIDRTTGAAQNQKLFHREYVPRGIAFALRLTGDGLTDDELALIGFALQQLAGEDGLRLGAETREGWGALTSSAISFRSIAPDEWQTDRSAWRDESVSVLRRAAALRGAARNVLRLPVDIRFTGPFLVNEPTRTKRKTVAGPDTLPDHAERIDVDGKVVLPASSFRGALRSRAEKILRTLGARACASTDPDDACKAIDDAAKAQELCLVCQLFGTSGWATPLAFGTFRCDDSGADYTQELVAIDRFTGGVSGSAKFDVHARWAPVFSGEIAIDEKRWDAAGLAGTRDAAVGLLLLALRDLADGDLRLGFGSSKGYGACEATIRWPANAALRVAALHRHLGVKAIETNAAPTEQIPASSVAAETKPHRPAQDDPEFYNPYHFVPSGKGTVGAMPADQWRKTPHLSHAKWDSDALSGRIVCSLTTLTPMVIGADQSEDEPAIVTPFVHPGTGLPAIPSTSLRGLISSIAEAASNSTMRILEDRTLSIRCSMEESLQAIGMIVDTPTGKKLRPLALPAIRNGVVPQEYRAIFPTGVLRVYVDGYRPAGTTVAYRVPSFLASRKPDSWSADNKGQYWYADLRAAGITYNPANGSIACASPHTRTSRDGRTVYLLGAEAAGDPIDEATYNADPAKYAGYTRGILRVLGIDNRGDIPTTKKHEIFIPYGPGTGPGTGGALLDAAGAVAEFERLAKERTDAEPQFPYSVKGSNRNASGGDVIELRDGDLVFFEPDAGGTTVKRLAISSIWRKAIDATVHEFFRKISPELLPMNENRTTITIAEQIFGFMDESRTQKARALAGKVRFSIAETDQRDRLLPPVTLKILSSPKPPSPSLYFRRDGTPGAVRKPELTIRNHRPQGRKFYLHHAEAWHGDPWRTEVEEHANQKVTVTPVAAGTDFRFHIDFDNLTREQVGLLCYALRPTDAFRHKIGMGKSLGLGSVRIDPVAVLLTDRKRRYRSAWSDMQRFHEREILLDAAEVGVLAPNAAPSRLTFAAARSEFRDAMAKIDGGVLTALETIGDPHRWPHPVHTPQLEGRSLEDKTYEWFVKNESRDVKPQFLQPVVAVMPEPLSREFEEAEERPRRSEPRNPREGGRRERNERRGEPVPPPPLRRENVIRATAPQPQPTEPWPEATLVIRKRGQAHEIETRKGNRTATCPIDSDSPLLPIIKKKGFIVRDVTVLREPSGQWTIVDIKPE